MSYTSTVDGEIEISPPLNSKEIRKFPKPEGRYATSEVELQVHKTVKELEEGELTVSVADAVLAVEADSDWSRSRTPNQLQEVVDTYPDHEFTGYLQFLGEDGKIWRLVIKDRKVTEVTPELVWPE